MIERRVDVVVCCGCVHRRSAFPERMLSSFHPLKSKGRTAAGWKPNNLMNQLPCYAEMTSRVDKKDLRSCQLVIRRPANATGHLRNGSKNLQ